MDNYIIKFFDGTTLEITEEEYKRLVGKSGLVVIPSLRQTINTSSISRILPKKEYLTDNLMNRKKQSTGILHDGTHVIRYFGRWFLNNGSVDNKGKPEKEI